MEHSVDFTETATACHHFQTSLPNTALNLGIPSTYNTILNNFYTCAIFTTNKLEPVAGMCLKIH